MSHAVELSHTAECQFCGKIWPAKFRRAVCSDHSPYDVTVWVEFYGRTGWMAERACLLSGDPTFCGVDHEPNGGYFCQPCWDLVRAIEEPA